MNTSLYSSFGIIAFIGVMLISVPAYAQTNDAVNIDARGTVMVSEDGEIEVDITSKVDGMGLSPEDVSVRMNIKDVRVDPRGEIVVDIEDYSYSDTRTPEEVLEKRMELREERKERILEIRDEHMTVRASTLADLRAKREERRAELADEEASTTPKFRNVMKNANEVRLAVHTLLASEDLVGGIGPRISEIAKRMNDTVGSTTDAEAKIESRGALKKLFFGGDRTAAEAIQGAVDANNADIAKLKELLADTSISAEVATDLQAQIEVLEKAQDRLATLADKEGKRRGLFGWLFAREETSTTSE